MSAYAQAINNITGKYQPCNKIFKISTKEFARRLNEREIEDCEPLYNGSTHTSPRLLSKKYLLYSTKPIYEWWEHHQTAF